MEKREYWGPYKDRYSLDERIPHAGVLSDPYNADGWEKVRLGYIEIIEEGGQQYAVITEKGRRLLANVGELNPHHPTQAAESSPSVSSYRRQIYAMVENMYGQEYRADFVDRTPEEKKKPHKYTLYVRPRREEVKTRMQYKTKVTGTLKEIYDKLHDKLAEGLSLKIMKNV